jgi:Cu-Zn family superoxide dismutase
MNFNAVLRQVPVATAFIKGSDAYPEIEGIAKFYQTPAGVLTVTEIYGLPTRPEFCERPIFALHIHDGPSCSGDAVDPFGNAGMHYNPYSCPHPYHAGDMPPLFDADGMAYSAFLSNSFTVEEIIGKTIVVHDRFDDFITQPAGNSGNKIACGEITPTKRRAF